MLVFITRMQHVFTSLWSGDLDVVWSWTKLRSHPIPLFASSVCIKLYWWQWCLSLEFSFSRAHSYNPLWSRHEIPLSICWCYIFARWCLWTPSCTKRELWSECVIWPGGQEGTIIEPDVNGPHFGGELGWTSVCHLLPVLVLTSESPNPSAILISLCSQNNFFNSIVSVILCVLKCYIFSVSGIFEILGIAKVVFKRAFWKNGHATDNDIII